MKINWKHTAMVTGLTLGIGLATSAGADEYFGNVYMQVAGHEKRITSLESAKISPSPSPTASQTAPAPAGTTLTADPTPTPTPSVSATPTPSPQPAIQWTRPTPQPTSNNNGNFTTDTVVNP